MMQRLTCHVLWSLIQMFTLKSTLSHRHRLHWPTVSLLMEGTSNQWNRCFTLSASNVEVWPICFVRIDFFSLNSKEEMKRFKLKMSQVNFGKPILLPHNAFWFIIDAEQICFVVQTREPAKWWQINFCTLWKWTSNSEQNHLKTWNLNWIDPQADIGTNEIRRNKKIYVEIKRIWRS